MALIEEAHKASNLLLDHAYVRIFTREDPDALCAAALLAHALRRESVDFHLTALPRLDDAAAKALLAEGHDGLILIGLSGDHSPEPLAGRRVILDACPATLEGEAVLDPTKLPEKSHETPTAALAYYIALAMSKRNKDLAILAAAGALADTQHATPLAGITADVVAQATDAATLLNEPSVSLHGATIEHALTRLDTPYVAGITGRARNVKKLLQELHISSDAAPGSLSEDQTRDLASFLTLRLLAQGAPDEAINALYSPELRALAGPHAGLEAATLARHAEAACATGKAGLAFAALWPDAHAAAEALDTHAVLRNDMVAALLRAERDRAETPGRLLATDAPTPQTCAPLARRIATSLLAPGRIAVARHANPDGTTTLALRSWSLDLVAAARHASEATGVRIHATRSSARATVDDETRFLKALEEALP